MILDDIVAHKKEKLAVEIIEKPYADIMDEAYKMEPTRDFKEAVRKKEKMSIIAEVKKASPSKGLICNDFNHKKIAEQYQTNNVSAISVLTEEKFFLGSNEYLKEVKEITTVPILRKDFIIDSYQIYQARILGADAILLIAAILTTKQISEYKNIAKTLGMACLVEVHNRKELDSAIEAKAEIIGINNRDLKSFVTQITTTEELIRHIPKNIIRISESGVNTFEDMKYLEAVGADGVLIGESLMRSGNITVKLAELRGEKLG